MSALNSWMADTGRRIRFTVRFSEAEFAAFTAFADAWHLVPSAALRWLVATALAGRRMPERTVALRQREATDN